ncbi:MAG: hypothetical protein HYV92_14895 [Candidatus Rokubacteria bacterium]|nr:hypothetical protein [Candidatus Rokubacteria bacterium]MBI2555671.1 hypothetical protein [Candidatus Rokubacteria bacterium]
MPPLIRRYIKTVMGVATWMFPRPTKDDARYRPELAETVYWVMTISTALRAVAELMAAWSAAPILRVLVALGGLGQLLGAALFVINMWTPVRMPSVTPLK